MSRSKHTRQDKKRAARQSRELSEPQEADDLTADAESAQREPRGEDQLRQACESGNEIDTADESCDEGEPQQKGVSADWDDHDSSVDESVNDSNDEPESEIDLPRIIIKRPRAGFLHPLNKADILEAIEFFGEQCFYGLKTVKMLQGTDSFKSSSMLLGRIEVPDGVILYDQPEPPWVITGLIPDSETKKLTRAGAVIETRDNGLQTVVHWSTKNLKHYILFDVFMREIGHHIIQQYKGKRNTRVVRTKDHEYAASLFAQRCREDFLSAHEPIDIIDADLPG